MKEFFTPEVITTLVFLLTMPLTTLVGTLFRLEGATASTVANAVMNVVAKGIIMVIVGQATTGQAAVLTIVGILTDKVIYDLLTARKNAQIKELKQV
jgi:hypothetical protein